MEDLVNGLLQIQQQIRILHWQTKSYARHKAYGKTYDQLGDLIDEFMEVHMGKYGRFELQDKRVALENLEQMTVSDFIDQSIEFLIGITEKVDSKRDTDLLNIRDEMLAKMNRLKYLLTLK
jgi:hypothetical protein